MGSQWIRALDQNWATLGRDSGHMRFALLGRTAADVRDVMLEGPSGLLNIYPPSLQDQVIWTPTRRRIELPGGAVGLVNSAEEPDQLRGPAFHCFPAGTLVRTSSGPVPIEKVQVGDLVWTRTGLCPVEATSVSKSEVATLTHARGQLVGTAEHPVLTQRGWIPLSFVSPTDTLVGWANGSGRSTIGDGLIGSGMARRLSGVLTPSGQQLTVDSQFLPGMKSIISISTASMMSRATSLLSPPKRTRHSTRQLSSPGFVNSAKSPSTSMRLGATPSSVLSASYRGIGQYKPYQIGSGLKTSSSACTAGLSSELVLESIAVKDVSTSGHVTDVYNLMVQGTPEFFANDVLVHNCSWSDETASYKQVRSMAEGNLTAWENLRIATRLGTHPQILATTTPKRIPLLKTLLAEAEDQPGKFILRRGKTTDNVKLSSGYLDTLFGLYGGTQLGKQELEGEMLDDVVGAMTSEVIIEQYRVTGLPIGIPWIKIVGVDPSVAEKPHDECGIVVVYISNTYPVLKRHAFIVEDLSLRASPTVWGDVVVRAAHEHGATVVAETNQGANLVKQMVRQSAAAANLQNPQIREVWSSKSKSVRSEPVGGAYARGRIHHVNFLPELEDQIGTWVPGESGYSPDRMDALVHACAAGMFPEALINGAPGSTTLHSVANQRIPLTHQVALPARRGAM